MPSAVAQYLSRLVQVITSSLKPALSQNEASSQIILTSPNGTNYSVTVSNAGALVVAANSGKTRP